VIKLDALLAALAPLGGALDGPAGARAFTGFAHDSRTVTPGALFVALRTAKADGHEYINEAIARGASGVLCERLPAATSSLRAAGITVVLVPDARAALLAYARQTLATVRPRQIVVAGAVGKSSAAQAIVAALGNGPQIFSNGDRNDELGLPLALGGLDQQHEIAVIEVAAATGSELRRLAALVSPDILVLTAAAPPTALDAASVSFRDGLPALLARLDGAGGASADFASESPRSSATGERRGADGPQPIGAPSAAGVAERLLVVNAGDPQLAALLASHPPATARLLRYGHDQPGVAAAEVTARVEPSELDATAFAPCIEGARVGDWQRSGAGSGRVEAALAAIVCARALGVAVEAIRERLALLTPLPGRLTELAGRDGLAVLDDTVSANAASLALALDALRSRPQPHAAVLGEISGVASLVALDAQTVQRLLSLDLLVLQGHETAALARELRARAPRPERILSSYSARDSADALLRWGAARRTFAGDALQGTVLVKGSDGARMERVVELLLPDGAQPEAALVRQDAGWRLRTYVPSERPTWVEIDLGAIRDNLRALQRAAGGAEVMAVLKADAYGHGARWVARTAALNGAAMLGVASLNEAVELRKDGIATPILILGYAPPWQARDLALSDIQAAIFSDSVAEQFSRAAVDLGRRIGVHVKIDTGMTRLGVTPEEALPFVERLARLPGLELRGIFTHLATSDTDPAYAREQGERFAIALEQLRRAGFSFRHVHVENSGAILRGLPFAHTMVRAGLALYGLSPLPPGESHAPLRPALAWKTRVAQVKAVPSGTGVSYGHTFVTSRASRIAVLPVGYGDGFRRGPHNAGEVLVRGRRAPIVGVVNMDMTMIDVTDVAGVEEGDEAVLIGRQGDAAISAAEMAATLGTIVYEVVTQIMPRVPRQTR
jgi:Alr-MurF fusion protein